jgi:hypothetical protein
VEISHSPEIAPHGVTLAGRAAVRYVSSRPCSLAACGARNRCTFWEGLVCVPPGWVGRFAVKQWGAVTRNSSQIFVVFDANARSIRGMHNLLLITSSVRTTRAVQPVAQLAVRFSAWLARFQQLYSQRFQASLQRLVL